MQLLQLLLAVAFHRHGMNIGAACRFEHGVAVIAVGLVAAAIGPHVVPMQQPHLMPHQHGEATGAEDGHAAIRWQAHRVDAQQVGIQRG